MPKAAKKSQTTPTPKVTFKSLCEKVQRELCQPPIQDHELGSSVLELYRAFDPKGKEVLGKRKEKALRAILEIVVKHAQRTIVL